MTYTGSNSIFGIVVILFAFCYIPRRNIRESNNLFHWVFQNVTLKENSGGGVRISLPYVWQYNENFTHTVYVNESTFIDNLDFEFVVDGHFARVNITKNLFERNTAPGSVVSLRGMEKEMFIRDNIIRNNLGTYMFEVRLFMPSPNGSHLVTN